MLISMILNIIRMEIWKGGNCWIMRLLDLANRNAGCPCKFEFQMGHTIFGTFLD